MERGLCNFSADDCIYCSSYSRCMLKTIYYTLMSRKVKEAKQTDNGSVEVLEEIKKFIPLFENQDMHIIESGTNMSLIKEKLDAQADDLKAIKEYLGISKISEVTESDNISKDKTKRKIWG